MKKNVKRNGSFRLKEIADNCEREYRIAGKQFREKIAKKN